jgi:uncharacterized protein (UPF0276 family)
MSHSFLSIKKQLPILGVGLGLRRELAPDIFACRQQNKIDWLEFVPENYMSIGGKARDNFEKAASLYPLLSHGVNLSIGSADELNDTYLKNLKSLLELAKVAWWSDHLCFASVDGIYLHDLLPLPFTKEAITHVSSRARTVQDYIGKPFLLENTSFYMYAPGNEMSEAQFLSEILEQADCGLLLDVNNVYVNSVNHKFDPYEFIDQIPLERVVQIHIAGHKQTPEAIIDTHGAPVIEPVFKLLEYVLSKSSPHAILLERDQNFPEFDEIIKELDTIRSIAAKSNSILAAPSTRHVPNSTRNAIV